MMDIFLVPELQPHELERSQLRGIENIVQRVAAQSAALGHGADLLLRIYMAGIYHGQALAQEPGDEH